jgi:hypothetical protein
MSAVWILLTTMFWVFYIARIGYDMRGVDIFARILMACDRGGRLYKYFLLDKLYKLLYWNNAVNPCKSTSYVPPPPPPPSK